MKKILLVVSLFFVGASLQADDLEDAINRQDVFQTMNAISQKNSPFYKDPVQYSKLSWGHAQRAMDEYKEAKQDIPPFYKEMFARPLSLLGSAIGSYMVMHTDNPNFRWLGVVIATSLTMIDWGFNKTSYQEKCEQAQQKFMIACEVNNITLAATQATIHTKFHN